ncbi:MAG: hypothetical protein HFG26_09955 [Provencibacterium sp.]|nr:hypothetical protein [Provencibacterium sp.]
MEFFLGKTRVYISFWFLCLAALAALYDKSLLLLPLLAAVALHEAVHLFFLLSFQIRIRSFSLLPYGARLDCDLSTLPAWKKAAVYLSAPAAGLCVGLFYRAIDPASIFGVFNLCLGAFNLLPLPPLDGGNALTAFAPSGRGSRIARLPAALCLGAVWGGGVWLGLFRHNPSLLILALYLTLAAYPPKVRGRREGSGRKDSPFHS